MEEKTVRRRNHCLSIAILDVFRFICLVFVFLPFFMGNIVETLERVTVRQIFVMLASPQLVLPLYTVAVAFGFARDNNFKIIGISMKVLALFPSVMLLLVFGLFIREGFLQGSTVPTVVYTAMLIFLDLAMLILFKMYKPDVGDTGYIGATQIGEHTQSDVGGTAQSGAPAQIVDSTQSEPATADDARSAQSGAPAQIADATQSAPVTHIDTGEPTHINSTKESP